MTNTLFIAPARAQTMQDERREQAQRALDKAMNERCSNFDRGAVFYWAEKGFYQVKPKADALEAAQQLNETLRQQAESHAMEARTMRTSLHECYQAVTGSKGEPGNWNGAEPIKAYVEAAQLRIKTLEAEKERLIEDRARFPDRPDWVGDMIGAHFKNLEHKAEAAEGFTEKYRLRLMSEQRKRQELEAVLEKIATWGNSDHCTKLRSFARAALRGEER